MFLPFTSILGLDRIKWGTKSDDRAESTQLVDTSVLAVNQLSPIYPVHAFTIHQNFKVRALNWQQEKMKELHDFALTAGSMISIHQYYQLEVFPFMGYT